VITLHPITRAAATHRLEVPNGPPSTRPPDTEEWARVSREMAEHGLVGLLAAAYEDGVVALTDEQANEVADHQLTTAMAAIEIEAAFLQALDVLEPHGTPVRVLKGLATAHLDYPEPTWRTFNDADLLVRSADVDRVVEVLAAAGYGRDLPERRTGFDRRFGKDVTVNGPNRVQLDLHRTFAVGGFGLRQLLDDLWLDSAPFRLGSRTAQALVAEDRLLHACFAAVFGGRSPRVALLRDLAQLLARSDLDADLVMQRAIRWRCVPVVTSAVDAAVEALGSVPPSPIVGWARTGPARWRDRALLAAHPFSGGSAPLAKLSGVVAVPGLGGKAAFLRGLFLPDRDYRRARVDAGRRPEWRLPLAGFSRSARKGRGP